MPAFLQSPPPATHFVVGRDAAGVEWFYTGAAGAGFVSRDRDRAFVGWYAAGAGLVADRLNRMSTIHGITFEARAA